MEQYIYELNQYDLEQVWSGYASEVQQEEYNRLYANLKTCLPYSVSITAYTFVLLLMLIMSTQH